ncbi:MAG: class I SAM-dependent methyltransferase [Litorilinea sp.]
MSLHARNSCPALLTQRIHEILPMLKFVNCQVESIATDETILILPFEESSLNQNGTQHTASFYLLADCALAVAIFGALPGVYVTGIHDRCRAMPIQIWTKQGTVDHLAPATGAIQAIVNIPPADAQALRAQLLKKGRADISATIRMFHGADLVATADFTLGVYADMPRPAGKRPNLFQGQNMKQSALMMAGLRADPLSQRVAQEQGRAIATRMATATPQLPALIQARTSHLEEYLNNDESHYQQVVVLGVGLDTRPLQFAGPDQHWYGIDLVPMIKARESTFCELELASAHVTLVEGDIQTTDWLNRLDAAGYRAHASTLFIIEGLSMYLEKEDLEELLAKLGRATTHKASRVWLDHVTPALFHLELPEVQTFLASMSRLGEPFILGFNDGDAIGHPQWQQASTTSAAEILDLAEPVHAEYRFSILKPVTAQADLPARATDRQEMHKNNGYAA